MQGAPLPIHRSCSPPTSPHPTAWLSPVRVHVPKGEARAHLAPIRGNHESEDVGSFFPLVTLRGREQIRWETHSLHAMNNHRVSFVLFLSILAISTAAVLVRLVPDMHPIAIAFWRTAIVAVLLGPSWTRASAVRPTGKQALWTILAGLCLALHFWTWFASLQFTTVMRSTVLVCLTPVWAGLLAWIAFSEAPKSRFWGGIFVALIGVTCMALGGETAAGQSAWTGDLLALAGGILSGVYLTIGRGVRPHVDWGPYGALVCASCAGWLLAFSLLTQAPLDVLGPHAWWVIAAMALGPQLLGHIGFAYVVRFIPAYIIGAVILLEPVGATALGALVLDEWPSAQETLGALIIIIGVMGATLRRDANQPKPANQSG